ncbi:MAG: hypothetical protein EBT51_00330 [Flavobacteriaceae bacterium]|nr:hypothetical protein [Flavobacteriaceae bacterium]
MGRLYFLLIFVFSFGIAEVQAQELDDIFNSFEQEEEFPLLPDKMLFTQRFLWGENGLLRRSELAPLSPIQRSREIELRRKMLITHQVLGYVTLASMIAQGIIGGKLYNCDNCNSREYNQIKNAHETMAGVVNVSYFSGAALSLFAPPPLINRTEKGLSSARAHKWLASIHFSAMVATNLLADGASESQTGRNLHRIAAYTAFGSFATATLVLTF